MTQGRVESAPPEDWAFKRADFDQLEQGRFVDPAPNDPSRRRSPTGASSALGIRFAGPWTFKVWSEVSVAELWHWVALATFLDPSTVPVEMATVKEIPRRSAVGLFRDRLVIASQLAQLGGMDCLSLATDPKRSLVKVGAFIEWSADVQLPLPDDFPRVPTTRRTSKLRTSADAPFLRLNDILPSLPFSAATLWRRVKAGTFPAPLKISRGVTAWRREDIDAWHAAQGSIAPQKRS